MLDANIRTLAHLIEPLLLEADRRMEDASPELALALPASLEAINSRVASLEAAAECLMSLATAARNMLRQHSASTD